MKTGAASIGVLLAAVCVLGSVAANASVIIETDNVWFQVSADARALHLIDKSTGREYVSQEAPPPIAYIKKGGQPFSATGATRDERGIVLAFGELGVEAVLGVEERDRWFRLSVVSINDAAIEELTFLNVSLTVQEPLAEPFACCALALNLQTRVQELPGPNKLLRATCYPRFGLVGAEAAFVGCPADQLRDAMKDVVRAAPGLPQFDEPIGGPWAMDAPINRGSYLFDFGKLTEETADAWIALAQQFGINQIDFHTGTSLRFGDCRPNPDLFPRGRESVRAVIDKLHEAGIVAGLHTYASFVAKDTPWVTPVPDPRLGKDATFTLAEAISAEADAVPVLETTEAMSTITGFAVRNSVTVQIDDELITYTGIAKEPPYAFTGCTRGACDTTPAPHEVGAPVHHLKECFGLFSPEGDSDMLAEVAAHTAETFNECGFDMIYLDALDGGDVLGGAENSWHYESKFVFEICNRLKKAPLMEMSTFHHHLWYVRARMGAWDHPNRWHKRYVDVHSATNNAGRGMFLPMHLGWWAVKTWSEGPLATQIEPTFPDDIEYLMGKCLGHNVGFSLMGVDPDNLGEVPAYQRLAPIFRQYEELRHAGYFSEEALARLRVPGDEYTLEQEGENKWGVRPVRYAKHKVQGLDGWSNAWTVANPFGDTPAQFRIEALYAAAPYDSPEAVVLEDFASVDQLAAQSTQAGVSAAIATTQEQSIVEGGTSGLFTATSVRQERNGAWASVGKQFSPPADLSACQALGVWVYGDGQQELLNVQLKSPAHVIGGIGDHYINVDFEGWRYFELIEPEGGRMDEIAWPYGGAYATYREWVDYGQVASLALWYNRIPAGGKAACAIAPIKALPLVETAIANPSVTIAGKTVRFPAEIPTGCYLEYRSPTDCKVYGPKGELLSEVTPEGDAPVLAAGENAVSFSCDPPAAGNPRAYVTVVSASEEVIR